MMHRALHFWKNIQLYLWLLFFGYLISKGEESNYLAQLQSDLLYVGSALLLLILLAGLLPGSAQEGPSLGWRTHLQWAAESLAHAIPILLVLLAGVTTLNINSASLREGIQMRILDPNRSATFQADPLADPAPGSYLETTHLQLYGNPRLH
uniref:hypothetical protein n=1 Tax=Candidatus Magnetaquicoccus inordinatus TaxID=2496818 RepID=UPI00102B7563